MKFGLFLALLVLLASTNVFGQEEDLASETTTRPHRTKVNRNNRLNSGHVRSTTPAEGLTDGNIPSAVTGDDTKPLTVIHDADQPVIIEDSNRKAGSRTKNGKKPITIVQDDGTPIEVVQGDVQPDSEESRRRPIDRDDVRENIRSTTGSPDPMQQDQENVRPDTQVVDRPSEDRDQTRIIIKPASGRIDRRPDTQVVDRPSEDRDQTSIIIKPASGTIDHQPTDRDQTNIIIKPASEKIDRQSTDRDGVSKNVQPDTQEVNRPSEDRNRTRIVKNPTSGNIDRRPDTQEVDRIPSRPRQGSDSTEDQVDDETPVVAEGIDASRVNQSSGDVVHVSGNIILVKYRSSIVDSVQYDVDGAILPNADRPSVQGRLPFAQDFIARRSRVILYVSTSKTLDRKLAFAQFRIKYTEDHFPLSFDLDVPLPSQQRGLLERADVTLYFFVYVTNPRTRIDTFLPAGTSQILLQGTNRLVQKLDVYVRATGIEVSGLFRRRFGQGYIRPGTSFQVLIVPEQSLSLGDSPSLESVAQATITNVPSMFPVPFSLLVHHQMFKPNTKYYAVGYIFDNGVRRLISQEPILVINEQRVLVTPQVIFTVIPSPFILSGVVTRSMPGSFFLQPRSSLILRLHEVGSNARDIIFKLPEVITLPQVFQVNISEVARFDPSKNYDIRALITDEKNNIYMASLEPIPLPDELSKLTVPVDDLLYYVQASLQSSTNQPLNYIPGSTAQVFVTDSPEVPTKPIVSMRLDSIPSDFRDFSIRVPATAIQRGRNYYLVMMIDSNGTITHLSKTLLISNNQPPPFSIQLPVLSLNLVTGVIFDVENRPAQWSSSSYANLFLLDTKAANPEKAIVQVWKIHLENDFPIRFEIQLDFSRLLPDRAYRLQAAIDNGRNSLEYKPAGSVLALNPDGGIVNDVRIPVRNVKTSQLVNGLIYINDIRGPLPETSEIIVQLSSSPSLTNPTIVDEIHLKVEGRQLPVNFTMNLPLDKIDINAVYYFFVQYIVRGNVVIPSSQAFAFSPRNEATVVLTLARTPQIPILGQVTSTGSPLILPPDSTLHLYITDDFEQTKPVIFSEVFLQASSNSLYEFTMNVDSVILRKKIPLYLRADILFDGKVILSIPRPALLQITPGGEWNINLVIDLPTILIGQIIPMSQQEALGGGQLDVFLEILERDTKKIVDTSRIRLPVNLPQPFRVEISNDLFSLTPNLQARAVIKNCKGQVLFEPSGTVDIQPGLNLRVDLPVILTDRKKFDELQSTVNNTAPLRTGIWRLSVTGVVPK